MSSSEPKYELVIQRQRAELEEMLRSSNACEVADALYSASRYEDDWQWIQSQCLQRLTDPAVPVRWAAATCLGDLTWSRRFPIDKETVTAALEIASQDKDIADPALYSLKLVREFA